MNLKLPPGPAQLTVVLGTGTWSLSPLSPLLPHCWVWFLPLSDRAHNRARRRAGRVFRWAQPSSGTLPKGPRACGSLGNARPQPQLPGCTLLQGLIGPKNEPLRPTAPSTGPLLVHLQLPLVRKPISPEDPRGHWQTFTHVPPATTGTHQCFCANYS